MGKRQGKFNKYDDNGNPIVLQTYVNDELMRHNSRPRVPASIALRISFFDKK